MSEFKNQSMDYGNDPIYPLVSPLFGSSMVLQRGRENPIWGWAKPGTSITISFAGETKTAVAADNGKWTSTLKSLSAGGPYTLDIAAGDKKIHIDDILIGDVWFCSGQSNMEMGIGQVNDAEKEIATADYPQIRTMIQPKSWGMEPVTVPSFPWRVCTPETIVQDGWMGFSAAGYFFGRKLHQELNVPIGIISSSWGGTPVESWISVDELATHPDFTDAVERLQSLATLPERLAVEYDEWCNKQDAESVKYTEPLFDDTSWDTVDLPATYGDTKINQYDGIMYYRRTFNIGGNLGDAKLYLGNVINFDTVWINGICVGKGANDRIERVYDIPASALKQGDNSIALRIVNNNIWFGGLNRSENSIQLHISGGDTITLSGAWKYHSTLRLSDCSGNMPPCNYDGQLAWTYGALFYGMISPFLPFGISGALWYQGESNADRGYQYRSLLTMMIENWRKHWGQGEFPFYIVQLANWNTAAPKSDLPVESGWAELREAQEYVANTVPNCGIATAVDIGDSLDIHPKNKQDVGLRLALVALAKHYKKDIECSGPVYKSHNVEGGKIRVSFNHADGGLQVKDGILKTIAIAGDDRKFVWANAEIDGETLVVWSSEVANPVAVRYGWADDPVCNLYNKSGLPALPFRTDNWLPGDAA